MRERDESYYISTIKKGTFDAIPEGDGIYPRSLCGAKNFVFKGREKDLIASVDFSEAFRARSDLHCQMDAKEFEANIDKIEKFEIDDKHNYRRFLAGLKSNKGKFHRFLLEIILRNHYLFKCQCQSIEKRKLIFYDLQRVLTNSLKR